MPMDPLQLLRLQYGLGGSQPIDETDPNGPMSIGGGPVGLARMQLGLPAAVKAAQDAQAAEDAATIEMPEDYVGPKHTASIGQVAAEPLDSAVQDDNDQLLAETKDLPPTPPVDSDLPGSPAFQAASTQAAAGQPMATTGPTGEHSVEAPAASGGQPTVPPPVDSDLAGSPAFQAQQAALPPVEQPKEQPKAVMVPPETDEGRALQISRAIDAAILQPALMTMDEKGNPETKLSPEDVAFKAMVQNDQSLLMKLNAIQAQGTLAAEEARRRVPALAEYKAETERITKESDAEIRNWIAEIKRGYDDARQAAEAANAAYPNPDDLLGGNGSWARAIGLGLAAASAGIPGSTVASVVDQQLRMQMAGRQARYGQLTERANMLAGLAGQRAKDLDNVIGGHQALLAAARDRLAARMQVIANGLADPTARLGMLNAAADLYKESAKSKFEAGKDLAEIRLKAAQEREANAKAGKYIAGASSAGGTGHVGDLKRGMWGPDGQWMPFSPGVKLSESDQQDLFDANVTYRSTDRKVAELIALGREMNKARTAGGQVWSKWKSVNERRFDTLANDLANEMAKMRDPKSTNREGEVKLERQNLPELKTFAGMEDEAFESLGSDIRRRLREKYQDRIDLRLGPGYSDQFVAAQPSTAPVKTTATQDLTEAQGAVARATSPQDKRAAEKALAEAKKKLEQEKKADEAGKQDIGSANTRTPARQVKTGDLPTSVQSSVDALNNAADTYNQHLNRFKKAYGDSSYLKGIKGQGNIDDATKSHNVEVAQAAKNVEQSRGVMMSERRNLITSVSEHLEDLPPSKLSRIAVIFGLNPKDVNLSMSGQVGLGKLKHLMKKAGQDPNAKVYQDVIEALTGGN